MKKLDIFVKIMIVRIHENTPKIDKYDLRRCRVSFQTCSTKSRIQIQTDQNGFFQKFYFFCELCLFKPNNYVLGYITIHPKLGF